MSELETALAAAREKLAQLEVNPLFGHEKQTAEIRKDALAIFDEMTATLPTACPHLQVGEYGGDGHRWTHCGLAEQQGRVAEAARAFAAVTLGLENTKEGAALLCALKRMEDAND